MDYNGGYDRKIAERGGIYGVQWAAHFFAPRCVAASSDPGDWGSRIPGDRRPNEALHVQEQLACSH